MKPTDPTDARHAYEHGLKSFEFCTMTDVRVIISGAVADLHRTILNIASDVVRGSEELRKVRFQQSEANRMVAIERLKATERRLL